jgi:hypothetical protein
MTRARTTYVFGETPLTSSKLNQEVSDYLTRGQLIVSSVGHALRVSTTGGASLLPPAAGSWVNLGWYPFNPLKQVYDRMDIIFNLHASGTATDLHIQYSLDSDASWINANPGHSSLSGILGIRLPEIIGGGTSLGPALRTVDLSGILSGQYIGLRLFVDVTQEAFSWFCTSFLYLSSETPF